MNILYIWDADYPWDVRVEKICRTLYKNGYNVHIAARNLKKLVEYENISGLHIHRLATWKNDRINYVLSFPLFFSPIWMKFLVNIIQSCHIDIIIVRDLPLAIAGIWAGRRNNIPVIFDMAEDYVAMIRDIWRVRKFQGLNLIVRNPYLSKLVEMYALKKADRILVVVEEAKKLIIDKGVKPEKVVIVSNTSPIENYVISTSNESELLTFIKNHYSVIYTGGIQMGRGIQVVFNAIPHIIKWIPNFLFVIMGDGYAISSLKELARIMKISDHVLWTGWVDHDKIFEYIKCCKVGIIPHLVTDHVNTTIPNKIFDYMGLGLKVIASDSDPMKRIIENEKCGLTFRNGDSYELVKVFVEIYYSNYDYGFNGIRAVKEKYNWDFDSSRLIETIKKMVHDNFSTQKVL